MLELYIIRHGLAGDRLEDKAEDDARPLKKKGKEQMKEVSKGLKEMGTKFDTILTSPLLRATETAEIIKAYCGNSKKVVITDLLLPEASYSSLITFLNKIKGSKKVAIVGHEPHLSGFASYCIAKNKDPLVHLKKGGVLKLEIDKGIKPGKCMLAWLMEPKHLIKP